MGFEFRAIELLHVMYRIPRRLHNMDSNLSGSVISMRIPGSFSETPNQGLAGGGAGSVICCFFGVWGVKALRAEGVQRELKLVIREETQNTKMVEVCTSSSSSSTR